MNHRKHKQQENLNKPKKEIYMSYTNDPPDARCPYCGETNKSCSYVSSYARSMMRAGCGRKHNNEKKF